MDDESVYTGTYQGDSVGLRRGAIWWADLPAPWGRRPVVLIARNTAHRVLRTFAVAPLTTRIRRIPSSVVLEPPDDPVPNRCVISLDHIRVIESELLIDHVGQLSAERMAAVDQAIHFALGLDACPK